MAAEVEEPVDDDLAQVVLRDVPAGVLTALVAFGGLVAALAALRRDAEQPLVGAWGQGLAFVVGAGLGVGLTFAGAEAVPLLWAARVRVPWWSRALDLLAVTLACGVTLALLSPAAPTFGAFELLLVQTSSTREASALVLQALQKQPQELAGDLTFVALATVAIGLPLLLARRLHCGRTAQAAVATTSAAAWLAVAVARDEILAGLPTSTLAALLLGGALAAVASLDLCDRLVRRVRRRTAPSRPARRRLPAAVTLVALLAVTAALVTPYPCERPSQLLARVQAATTSDPGRLSDLSRPQILRDPWSTALVWSPPRLFRNSASRSMLRATVGAPTLDGLSLLETLSTLGVAQPPGDDTCRGPILVRAARAGVEAALEELARPLVSRAIGRTGPGLVRAAARVAVRAPEDDDAPAGADPELVWWRERTAPWRTDPAHRAVVAHHVARARAGDIDAFSWLALLWQVAPPCRAEVELVLGQVASGCVPGNPDLVPWRAVERLVPLAWSPEATPGLLDTTFTALRRHAVREGGPIVAPAARRVLFELLLKHRARRLAEDQERVPDHGVEVAHPLLGLSWALVAASGRPASLTELAGALRRTPARATTDGPGAAALEALARGDRREGLRLGLEGLHADPADPDALRALARVDLDFALEVGRGEGSRAGLCSRADAHLTWAFEGDPTNPALLVELAVARAAGGTGVHREIEARVWLLAARTLDPEAAEPVALALEEALPGAEVRDSQKGEVLAGRALLARVLVDRAGDLAPGEDPSPVRRARSRLAARLAEARR